MCKRSCLNCLRLFRHSSLPLSKGMLVPAMIYSGQQRWFPVSAGWQKANTDTHSGRWRSLFSSGGRMCCSQCLFRVCCRQVFSGSPGTAQFLNQYYFMQRRELCLPPASRYKLWIIKWQLRRKFFICGPIKSSFLWSIQSVEIHDEASSVLYLSWWAVTVVTAALKAAPNESDVVMCTMILPLTKQTVVLTSECWKIQWLCLRAVIVKLGEMQPSGLKAHSLSLNKHITLFLLFLSIIS